MKKTIKVLGIIVLVAVIGFSMAACGGDDDGGGGSERWRIKKYTSYTVTDGVASAPSETVYNWITDRYTSDTNYESKYTTGSTTFHQTRNGQNIVYTFTSSSSTQTTTYLIDSASGLDLKTSFAYTSSTQETTSETSYNIDLISDSGGVKTYKHYYKTLISNGVSQDVSNGGYSEYKTQNGRTLEQKRFTADGVLDYTLTYTLSDNAVIKAKLGNYSLSRTTAPTYTTYSTVEVLSDSATELVIRQKSFTNNVLSGQTDYTYEKV